MNLQALTQHYPGELQGASWEAPRGGSQGLQAGNRGDQQKKKKKGGRWPARREGERMKPCSWGQEISGKVPDKGTGKLGKAGSGPLGRSQAWPGGRRSGGGEGRGGPSNPTRLEKTHTQTLCPRQ